jgi:Raf kinase inhibitor-like YbhB/YbcL family protein
MQLLSTDFVSGGEIPAKFTCDGDNVNPNLVIQGVPKGTRSMALVLDDPDAPSETFTHWLVWNVNPITDKITSGVIPEGASVGLNSLGETKYKGPCPPSGTHNYIFTLYALDLVIDDLNPSSTDKKKLLEKLSKHILGSAELIGLYKKGK